MNDRIEQVIKSLQRSTFIKGGEKVRRAAAEKCNT